MSLGASFRIQSVARMTGIAAATLRAWERRYGLPTPARSASAYRLFTHRDVELVKRMHRLIEGGLAPNEAARQLLSAGSAEPAAAELDPYQNASDRLLAAIAQLDSEATLLEVRRALLLGSGDAVFNKVLRPVMEEVGHRWACGTLSVAHEHFASHVMSMTANGLLQLTEPAAGAPTLLLACVSGEWHELPLYGAALSARSWGFRTIMLGAHTPPEAIARAVRTISPACVGLSITIPPGPAAAAHKLIQSYAEACGTTPFVVGGQAAPALARWVEKYGGLVSPGEPEEAGRAIARLVRRPLSARRGRGRARKP